MNNGVDRKVQLATGTQTNFADDEFPADLLVELDRSRPRTLRAQLERGLRQAIARKTLAPGTAPPNSACPARSSSAPTSSSSSRATWRPGRARAPGSGRRGLTPARRRPGR